MVPLPRYTLGGIAGNTGDAHGAPNIFATETILQG
jgi:hypothetical protein